MTLIFMLMAAAGVFGLLFALWLFVWSFTMTQAMPRRFDRALQPERDAPAAARHPFKG